MDSSLNLALTFALAPSLSGCGVMFGGTAVNISAPESGAGPLGVDATEAVHLRSIRN
jgi:hypothetical protein